MKTFFHVTANDGDALAEEMNWLEAHLGKDREVKSYQVMHVPGERNIDGSTAHSWHAYVRVGDINVPGGQKKDEQTKKINVLGG